MGNVLHLRVNGLRWQRSASLLLLVASFCRAQSVGEVHGRVSDAAGYPVAGAVVTVRGVVLAHTDSLGRFSFPLASVNDTLTVTFGSLESSVAVDSAKDMKVTLQPSTVEESAVVTATRSGTELGLTANSMRTIDASELTKYPALTLDERLRQQAGFELFRRSSSWVANPTTEGVSLRGLGSTAASRTLVLSDLVPLNDGFGGWIHWNEIPPEAIDAVTLASGGGSDLYGSSALGGVIDIVPSRPGAVIAKADLAAAGEDTSSYSARADAVQHGWSELLAGQSFRTAGYTVIAPALRGAVDVPSNVHYQTGRAEFDRTLPSHNRGWLTGNLLNEAHGNGTPIQTNGTRLWRYVLGDDWTPGLRTSGRVRGYGSDEAYRQSFSAISSTRSSEKLTRLQRVGTQEVGASGDVSVHLEHLAFVAGGDLRDLRATNFETPYAAGQPSGVQDTSARQRFFGGFGEILAQHGGWSGAFSLRGDDAANLATRAITQNGSAAATSSAVADRHEVVLDRRLGVVRQLQANLHLHASAFRAFRTPTMNELYRTGQVGSQITLPNSALLSERATGVEGGADWMTPMSRLSLQASYFWTEINRPVSAVLVSGNTYQRENLGQIQSQGVALAAEVHATGGLTLNAGYQYAHAVVTAFGAQPALVGKWIPDVPRHTATAQLRFQRGAGSYTLAARESGRAFDDSSNAYRLHSFFVVDAYAEYRVRSRVSVYLSLQNLLDRSIETARTPTLTLGTPFVAHGGVRVYWQRDESARQP